jgi:4-amino-4-deoxy-L-arabinose transferase-like glycosyltransferase
MPFPRSSPVRLLILAGAIHIALTTSIFLLGHYRLLPNTFDENGIGLTFAIDGTSYQKVATLIVADWHTYGSVVWLRARAPFHARVYAAAFAIFGKFLGHNILAAEPVNLFYYLGILSCVYVLGREIFSPRTGLIAATIVGAWPSFLLHSTQLIRDPLAILCFLALLVVLILLLKREFGWRAAIGVGIAGATLVTLFWITRGNMWNVVLVAIVVGFAMLVHRTIREKKLLAGNAIVMLWLIAAALFVPARLESSSLPGIKSPTTPLAIPSASEPTHSQGVWTRSIKQIADRRAGFRFSTSRASDIDADVRFDGAVDILKFLPRAAVIGFFSPFPNMWVRAGSFGFAGRLLSGLETLVMDFLYVAAAFCVWHERRNAKMWLLFLVATIGIVALGLVVVNAGALYRIRYVFWMMMIVIAAEGIAKLAHLTIFRTNPTKS